MHTQLQHLSQSLAQQIQPSWRGHLARLRIEADRARALLKDEPPSAPSSKDGRTPRSRSWRSRRPPGRQPPTRPDLALSGLWRGGVPQGISGRAAVP